MTAYGDWRGSRSEGKRGTWSNIASGMASVAQAFGTSTMPLMRPAGKLLVRRQVHLQHGDTHNHALVVQKLFT